MNYLELIKALYANRWTHFRRDNVNDYEKEQIDWGNKSIMSITRLYGVIDYMQRNKGLLSAEEIKQYNDEIKRLKAEIQKEKQS